MRSSRKHDPIQTGIVWSRNRLIHQCGWRTLDALQEVGLCPLDHIDWTLQSKTTIKTASKIYRKQTPTQPTLGRWRARERVGDENPNKNRRTGPSLRRRRRRRSHVRVTSRERKPVAIDRLLPRIYPLVFLLPLFFSIRTTAASIQPEVLRQNKRPRSLARSLKHKRKLPATLSSWQPTAVMADDHFPTLISLLLFFLLSKKKKSVIFIRLGRVRVR